MSILKTSHPAALQYLMTEDIYNLGDNIAEQITTPTQPALATQKVPQAVAEVPKPAEPAPAFFEYLGDNNKYILILINDSQNAFMSPKELEALQNILKAKKQELKDIALVNLHKYPSATFKSLKDFFVCNSVILFGINPSQLQLSNIQANQITVHEGTKVLATYGFIEMLSNMDKKRAFWDEMKKL